MIMIGLGSNLTTGEYSSSAQILEAAIDALEDQNIHIVKCSPFYETEPVPKSDQPWFVNAVACIKTKHSALELLTTLHDIEQKLGRTRREKWEARIIDLDLLCYKDQVIPSVNDWYSYAKNLTTCEPVIPHSRMHERDFVLIPLKDIAPDWTHPVLNKNVDQLLNEYESAGIVRLL